ncbi:alpha/beta hydrolase family protein [Chryseobacterium gleum]|uniref:alpha/beta hydrolase family protein n=1 Tax=Chryseobacterium gleum TaxID=250 RepID=UPI001E505802|nr:alpha/beta fold hydrolase [Chryseobacterium gleum]MCD9616923.1 hypothetical protein [Chryseobacterium gleum]MCE4067202.1 hypothetical protein [Chryseobacterium gleum]
MIRIVYLVIFLAYAYTAAQTKTINHLSKEYIDNSRANRLLLTEIWYPHDPAIVSGKKSSKMHVQKHPCILLSHGTGGNRFSLIWLAKLLAERGFIVASVDHFGNTTDNRIPEYFVRYWERPLDISFVLSQLLKDTELSEIIDDDKLAVVGFSLGGYTSLALAGAKLDCSLLRRVARDKQGKQELNVPELGDLTALIYDIDCKQIPQNIKDDRIKAFVALAPALGLGFSTKDQFIIEAPVLIIGTEGDTIAPIKSNAIKYHHFIPTSQIRVLKRNLGHYIFLPKVKEYSPDEAIFFEDPKGIDRTAVHQEIGRMILDFLNKSI